MQDNLGLFIGVFAAVCIIIVVLLIVSAVRTRGKKKKMLADNPNLVRMEFLNVVTLIERNPMRRLGDTGIILYSVNGQSAQKMLLGRSLLAEAGQIAIEYEFFSKSVGATIAQSFGRTTDIFVVEPGKKYNLEYNYMDRVLECKEK